jgi:hypothetical protein
LNACFESGAGKRVLAMTGMSIVAIFAARAFFYNDVLSLVSAMGCGLITLIIVQFG